jgi:hypothetical protein
MSMSEVASSQVLKSIGASGQISLGKEFAGRQVVVDSPAEGVWFIKAVKVVPDHEAWVDEPKVRNRLKRAIRWALDNPAAPSDPDDLPQIPSKASNAQRKSRSTRSK